MAEKVEPSGFRLFNFFRWSLALVGFAVISAAGIVFSEATWRASSLRLLRRSVLETLASTSHSLLGFILFWIIAPAVFWISFLGYQYRDHKKRGNMSPLKSAFADSTGPREMISLAILVGIWLVIFGCFLGKVVYVEHQDMAGRWGDVVREKNRLKGALASRDTYINTLENRKFPKGSDVLRGNPVVPQKVPPANPPPQPQPAPTGTIAFLTDSQIAIAKRGLAKGARYNVRILVIGNVDQDFVAQVYGLFDKWNIDLLALGEGSPNKSVGGRITFVIPNPEDQSVQLAIKYFGYAQIPFEKDVDPSSYRGASSAGTPPALTVRISR